MSEGMNLVPTDRKMCPLLTPVATGMFCDSTPLDEHPNSTFSMECGETYRRLCPVLDQCNDQSGEGLLSY